MDFIKELVFVEKLCDNQRETEKINNEIKKIKKELKTTDITSQRANELLEYIKELDRRNTQLLQEKKEVGAQIANDK